MRELFLFSFLSSLPFVDLFATLVDAMMVLVDAIFGISDAAEVVLGRRATVLSRWSSSYLDELQVLHLDLVVDAVLGGQVVDPLPVKVKLHDALVEVVLVNDGPALRHLGESGCVGPVKPRWIDSRRLQADSVLVGRHAAEVRLLLVNRLCW